MNDSFETYLARHAVYPKLIDFVPSSGLKLVVIIPAYNEPELLNTLESLNHCYQTRFPVEIIVLINHSVTASVEVKQINRTVYHAAQNWCRNHSTQKRKFYCLITEDLPEKHAGAGLARKVLMDEAIRRFSEANSKNGMIASLDADTLVSPNYLRGIEKTFLADNQLNVATFYFKHPIDENKIDEKAVSAMISYELYLRYYKHALASTGFPYAFYTIGSNFAVSANAYVKQGGMNRKQGGEDFYFLHKVFPLGHCIELTEVEVYPSARVSDRVPFGTGPALRKIMNEGRLLTYHPESFIHLTQFFNAAPDFFNAGSNKLTEQYKTLPDSIQSFIQLQEFSAKINELNQNSASLKTFIHRFYQWFNAFMVIKFLNHDQGQPMRIPIIQACQLFLKSRCIDLTEIKTSFELLKVFHALDKGELPKTALKPA